MSVVSGAKMVYLKWTKSSLRKFLSIKALLGHLPRLQYIKAQIDERRAWCEHVVLKMDEEFTWEVSRHFRVLLP